MRRQAFLLLVSLFLLTVCTQCAFKAEEADLVVYNATIYTVDNTFSTHQAMAIKDGKVLELGPDREILNKYTYDREIDARKRPVYPGFIDAHCHFYKYGLGLKDVNLIGTKSFEEVLQKVEAHGKKISKRMDHWSRLGIKNDWEGQCFSDLRCARLFVSEHPCFLNTC